MSIRRQPDPIPSSTNFGIINTGHMTGPAQAAPFSQNTTQTNNITNEAVDKARESIDDLRRRLEELRGQYPEVDAALRDLDMITPRLDEPDHDPHTMRYMLQNLVERCGGIPGVLGAAQLVQSTVVALLPGS
ncbi:MULTISPECIES: hypothetical protein [Streptomyces]|uniref:hypothetical protein n=1 Tax=Streptomyces TaxID=1883 RepID=UPI000FB73341|nr:MULTISPECIES: hypothetical protein [unclassified Streptomyces]MBQ0915689.1 hypothetical protein [Streptomyces sp. RM99]RSS77951.1 hypothetical protein EF911_05700 [Streptomyces sp. WAC06128]GGY87406.1 hypothetical protein GCM10010385_42270 [Streptomyces geysiriensis]